MAETLSSATMYSPQLFQNNETNGTREYSKLYGATNMIWSQQNAPILTKGDFNVKGLNYPDPKLSLRTTGALEQARKASVELLKRDQRSFRQLKFNTKISGTSGSRPATREDFHEMYNYRMLSQPLNNVKNFQVILLAGLLFILFVR